MNANDITVMNINGKESLWIDRGWRATDTDKDSGLSEAKLLGNSNMQGNYIDSGGTDYAEVDTRNLSTFYNCRKVREGGENGGAGQRVNIFWYNFSRQTIQHRTQLQCYWEVVAVAAVAPHRRTVVQNILPDTIHARRERQVHMRPTRQPPNPIRLN